MLKQRCARKLGRARPPFGQKRKRNFGAKAMQICDSAAGVSQTTMLAHRLFEVRARDILHRGR